MSRNHSPQQCASERDVRTSVTLGRFVLTKICVGSSKKRPMGSVRSVNSEIIFRLLSTFKQEASTN